MSGRILVMMVVSVALGACTVLRPKEPFSEAALLADDVNYVAHRYAKDALSLELRTDLQGAGYVCEPVRTGGHICSRSQAVAAMTGCADVFTVRVGEGTADASQARRCMGVVAPP